MSSRTSQSIPRNVSLFSGTSGSSGISSMNASSITSPIEGSRGFGRSSCPIVKPRPNSVISNSPSSTCSTTSIENTSKTKHNCTALVRIIWLLLTPNDPRPFWPFFDPNYSLGHYLTLLDPKWPLSHYLTFVYLQWLLILYLNFFAQNDPCWPQMNSEPLFDLWDPPLRSLKQLLPWWPKLTPFWPFYSVLTQIWP